MENIQKVLILVIIALIIGNIGLIYYIHNLNESLGVYSRALNNTLYFNYNLKVKPESEKEISNIVEIVKAENKTYNKILLMGKWTGDHVHNCYSDSNYCWQTIDGSEWMPLESTRTYFCDQIGGIRVTQGPFKNDPHWITYYKAGACGEQSVLFNEIANRSNFNVRIVYSDDECAHQWNEIWYNEQWYYTDVSILNSEYQQNENTCVWFNTTSNYLKNSYNSNICGKISKVTVYQTNEDRTSAYI